jgi:ribosome-associated translation inhibitor RaiA
MAEVTKPQTEEILEALEHVGVQVFLNKKAVVSVFVAVVAANVATVELYLGTKKLVRKLRKDIEKNRQRREDDENTKRTQVPD